MALSLVANLLTSLQPLVEKEVGLLLGVDEEMTKLSSTLSTIEAVLEDAERNHPEDRAVQDWLRKLKDAAYEVDDILDECSTEILRWESKGQSSGSLKKVGTSLLYPFENVKFRHRIGHMMKEISGKLAAIADERDKFHFRNMVVENRDEFTKSQVLRNLTLLKLLRIDRFTKLKSLPNGLAHLKALKSLSINFCDKLKSLPEEGLRGLESLQRLEIWYCKEFSSLSEGLQHLVCLESLEIEGCPKQVALPEGVKHLKSLQSLTMIGDSDVLVALPETLQHVPALQSLSIASYPKLTSLPDWLGNLTTLQTLTIFGCPKISSLPASIQRLTKLRSLSITDCGPELARRCEKGKGEDWHKIAHIPQVEVNAPAKPK
ncbi:hypothetical protein C3L33_20613, partial [Rhododendron williamsianum]